MRILFDGYWWFDGPSANRSVQREIIVAWPNEFPEDEICIALRASDPVGGPAAPELPIAKTLLWPHGLSNVIELGRSAQSVRADITVAHNFTPLAGRSATFIHDAMFRDHPQWFTRTEKVYFGGMLPTARRAALVTTSTRAEADRIERLAPHLGPVTAIGLAAPPAITRAAPTPPAAAQDLDDFALTVGRLNIRKNLESVIAAAAASESVTPDSPLLVVGSAEHSGVESALPDSIEALRRAGAVRFLGRVDDHELAWLYANAAVCVSLSLDEGFGLTPVEAAMFGAPVLASDIPAHRETVQGYAHLVPPDAPIAELADALDDAWRDPPDPVARIAIGDRYTWPNVVRAFRRAIIER